MHQRPRNHRRIAVVCFFLLFASLLQAQSPVVSACRQAVQFHQAGDYEKAIQSYRECLSLNPENFQARSNLGAALSHEGHYDEAIEQYTQALASAPAQTAPLLHLNLALAYYKSGRIAEAAAELESQHAANPAMDPHAKQITMLLADCDLRLGHPRKTVEILDAMADPDPNDQARNYMLGVALIRDGQVRRGQEVIDRILKNGDSAEAHFLLGSQMFQSNDFPGAMKEFQKAIDLNPKLPSLESYYGQAVLNTGDPDTAAEAFRKALAEDPNDYEANLLTGEILNQRRKNSEAIPYLERATLVRPDSHEARGELAIARNPALGQKSEDSQSSVGGLLTGALAPDFALPRLGSSKSVRLADYRGKRPVLLVFGSYTCPFFRSAAPKINSLYEKYGGRLPFLLVYIREAHSTADWRSTRNQSDGTVLPPSRTLDEKRDHATLCLRKLHIPYPALVDGMDRKVETAYAAWPSRAYLIGSDGRILYQTGLSELDFHEEKLDAAIGKSLSRAIRSRTQ